ncbi:hypothetical protein HanRHA438_Chr16g0742781 [Helianthus annuus]|uniref:Uncharacterized protein n=1 Tax=Helianthus annuus TaxID=4232 RepID=A0A9K3DNE6_HELAN|nr:hypothetical protein HanXRQr2_Chr16g0730341 [Helianthus annuus]KAJ0436863.1 hypothetical protein HanHA300_Chr16g0595451 [Helianthus annuus]KAJ0441132.1 hypothetical protein HanIR_Chr16g0794291 [Helianthus annuus]KAJ0459169.1 hypothetical protein HanHA89_Chr16g0645871 [Helianthus annuus]KAJ0639725.1 hypothetical protein HanLR1_Chr16g0607001 [Helianthus annuus]
MEGNHNDRRSQYVWDDESDAKQVHVYPAQVNRSRIRDGLDKTKAVAATGFKKIKQGSTVGFHWIKHKYQKTTHKQSYY